MNTQRNNKGIICALVVIAATMFVCTVNYVESTQQVNQTPIAITAYNA